MRNLQAKVKQSENPFYGKRELLNMFQQLPKFTDISTFNQVKHYLDSGYESISNQEDKKLFFSIVFSLGDINNREHNLFKKKNIKTPDQGGNSLRKVFFYCLQWMLTKDRETKEQFYKFLPIVHEYTNIENLFLHRNITDKRTGILREKLELDVDLENITDYIVSVISNPRTNDVIHTLWAKFLPRPDFSKRKRTKIVLKGREQSLKKKLGLDLKQGDTFEVVKELKQHTIDRQKWNFEFITLLSKKMNWEVIKYPKNTKFVGLEQYKKKYLRLSESHLFSSKEILNWDKDQLLDWFNTLPSSARYRVQRRLFDIKDGVSVKTNKWVGEKCGNIADVYQTWQESKIKAQEKLASISEEDKKQLTKTELKKLEKDAKVNTAGETLVSTLAKLVSGKLSENESSIVSQSVLNKIKLEVPVLIFADVSGSMQSSSVIIDGVKFSAFEMASIATTAFLMKNPDPELRGMFGVFSTKSDILVDYNYYTTNKDVKNSSKSNRYIYSNGLRNASLVKDRTIIDKTQSFIKNYENVKSIMKSFDFASTNINSVSKMLKKWVDSEPEFKSERIEQIQKYPIFLLISDGDFNSYNNQAQSIQVFQQEMRQWFNWNGLVVAWDVKQESYDDGSKFEGVENFMYFGSSNQSVLNQIFTNINDLDIVDVYLPLLAFSRSNRYDPVKELVQESKPIKAKVDKKTS